MALPLDHTAEPERVAVIRFGTTASEVLGMQRGLASVSFELGAVMRRYGKRVGS